MACALPVTALRRETYHDFVYNFEVEDLHTYAVGERGILRITTTARSALQSRHSRTKAARLPWRVLPQKVRKLSRRPVRQRRRAISLGAFQRHKNESAKALTAAKGLLILFKKVKMDSKTNFEDHMTLKAGNDNPRVVNAINAAIDLASKIQFEAAAQVLLEIIDEFPRAAAPRAYLSWYLLQLSRGTEAVAHGRAAIQLAPHSEMASLVYFHVLWNLGMHIEALDEMKRFMLSNQSREYINIIKEWGPDPMSLPKTSSAGKGDPVPVPPENLVGGE